MWSRYTQHDFSSADLAKSGDGQVIALRDLIVESERSAQQARDAAAAERRQVESARAQAIRQEEKRMREESQAAQSSSLETATSAGEQVSHL